MEIPEGEEREKGTKIFETIMTQNFPKLMSKTKPQVQEVHRTPSRINAKKLHVGISYSNYRKSEIKKKS